MLLLDNSAWSRLLQGLVPKDRANLIGDWMEQREVAICLPFLLEAGYSAQSAGTYRSMMTKFDKLPRIEIDRGVEKMALQAQREIAEIGHHRLPPVDVIIAACAHQAEAGVLHYDGDYDILAKRTSLVFESEWLAPPGTL
jgi:predicted nucleic acid-binding protein